MRDSGFGLRPHQPSRDRNFELIILLLNNTRSEQERMSMSISYPESSSSFASGWSPEGTLGYSKKKHFFLLAAS